MAVLCTRYLTERFAFLACVIGSEVMTVEHRRMEEAAKRAAQKAVNQLRMSRRTLRAGAGQVKFMTSTNGCTVCVAIYKYQLLFARVT